MPVHEFQNFVRVASRQHHDQHCARQRCPRQVKPADKAEEDERQRADGDGQQATVERTRGRFPGLDACVAQQVSEAEAEHGVLNRKSGRGRRRQRRREACEWQLRQLADNHVLRIPDEGTDAADVGAHGQREQIGQQRQFAAHDDGHDQRREQEADRVVNQQRGERARREDEEEQQALRRPGSLQHPVGRPIKEAGEIKVGRKQAHAQQQHQRVVVHRAIGLLRRQHAAHDHEHGAQQRGRRTIQRQDLQPPPADEQIGERENYDGNDFLLHFA